MLGRMRVSVVSVPVSDQERARTFYVDRLGFEVVADATFGPGMRWLQVAPPGSTTTFALVTWFDEMPAGSLRGLVLDSDDLDATRADLVARGAEVSEPSDQPGGRFCFVTDPDGNVLGLHQA
jgi:catechol 2,3-dioxygenase-like lactoylglutathione lyase family enzyme